MSSIDSSEEITSNEEAELTKEEIEKRRFEPYVKIPKWLRIILMILPASIIVGIILIIEYTVGFPETIFPTAIMAIIGMSVFGLVVLGDMAYRNVFVYKMLRHESRRSKVYKQILKDRKEASAKSRQEQTDEYEYDEEDEIEEDDVEYKEEDMEDDDEEIIKEEYTYDLEDERQHYKIKSFILRGGIITILIVNGMLLVILAAILQIALFGGFNAPT
jgi:hypothetical protein